MEKCNIDLFNNIKNLRSSLPNDVLKKHFEINPRLKEKYNSYHIENYLRDTSYHLMFLAEAILLDEINLFNKYLAWVKHFFDQLPVPEEDLIQNFILIKEELIKKSEKSFVNKIEEYWNDGIEYFKNYKPEISSFITENNPYSELANQYLNYLLAGDKKEALNLILKAFYSGVTIKELYLYVFQVTQKETGRLWQLNKISVAQEHFITAATQLIISQLYPYLFSGLNKKNKIMVTSIQGELHEIGARMIADFFEMEGWNSFYFGSNTPVNDLLYSIRNIKPDLIAISVTMSFHLSSTIELINKIRNDSSISNIKVIVGGYPFLISEKLWEKVGADGTAIDADEAIILAEQLIN